MARGVKTGGRKKGSLNKLSISAKEAFECAFQTIGGADSLAEWANENKGDFYKLFSRLIPVEQRVGDTNGEPVSIAVAFVAKHPG